MFAEVRTNTMKGMNANELFKFDIEFVMIVMCCTHSIQELRTTPYPRIRTISLTDNYHSAFIINELKCVLISIDFYIVTLLLSMVTSKSVS